MLWPFVPKNTIAPWVTARKIVALEMGGNNPLIVHEVKDIQAAAYETILSAYITSGQRCTCARRLILIEGSEAAGFIDALESFIARIRVGYFDDDVPPFMGPVVSAQTGIHIQAAQDSLLSRGAKAIVTMQKLRDNDSLLSPGLLDISNLDNLEDEEIFGPILQIIKVKSFEEALNSANNTKYGLSAGLLSDSHENFELFIKKIRAGVVNWNRQTTGASGKLPFGGCGLSGNHRPSGYFAADYCSYPVASLESDELRLPDQLQPGIE